MPIKGIRSLSDDGTKLDCQCNPHCFEEKTSYLLTLEEHDALVCEDCEFVRIDFFLIEQKIQGNYIFYLNKLMQVVKYFKASCTELSQTSICG